ncbi:Acetyl esterase/lipase [Collimonas sp. OK607]|uniref:alpha/beta hydrolase fold domain-containing protein n=1 Tax=Collimonas sp. OK607 TaxID=1798194 RepID=UPI0008F173D4|nr:alpha/beta hydrolase fold domain-containing protein [Collimonas sp. OK607]SFB01413.1 Acetyl esterase/lipase [Collimonas sp. OK607]
MTDIQLHRPGKLGNPDLVIRDDPRADRRLVAALDTMQMAGDPPVYINASTPLEGIRQYLKAAEEGSVEFFESSVAGMPPVKGVTTTVEKIVGVDGNEITLFIHHPTGVDGPVPGVLHLHGGGMCILDAEGPLYTRWRNDLAAKKMVVIGVEFRNATGRLGVHPFPAGLNDVSSALRWVSKHKARLGISKLVISGDSGGANLGLAATLKAKRDDRLHEVDGVYALCPYISNSYVNKRPELQSLYENDGLYTPLAVVAATAIAYDPDGENATNPLAWPYHASEADLEGLPPHAISVNELDPFRDEGLAYYRKLQAAGVPSRARMVIGTCHAAEINFMKAIPDVYHATLSDIAVFAYSL